MQRLALLLCLLVLHPGRGLQEPPRSIERIEGRAQFDELARIQFHGRFSALPNIMFAIDRADHGRVYYINSRRYRFHKDFLSANYLTLERGTKFYELNYLSPSRRFVLGTISWHAAKGKFTFELWEGDLTTVTLLTDAFDRLKKSFFAPLYFKANSVQHEAIARQITNLPRILPAELESVGDFVPLNQARNVGVLRIIDRMSDQTIIDRNEVIIFREPPLQLTPCSGLITTTFGAPLAHVNLLAKGWDIPNAFIKGAAEEYRVLEGTFVYFEVREDGFTLRPAALAETTEYGRRMAERSDLLTPRADLSFRQLTSLALQRKGDALRFGAKSANLGEVAHAVRSGLVKGVSVPPGFSIPFFYYDQFIRSNGLEQAIVEMLSNDRFNHDPAYRKQRLREMRTLIVQGRLDPTLHQAAWSRVRQMFAGKGVFVRSSTNAEDLENFSGAGLYTTVPNVRGRAELMTAIKTVWASVWNFEAYEARESAGINHAAVYPGVLIQEGVPADSAGVLVTLNPFDREDETGVYINAKRGLGIRVVEGQQIPEQVIFDSRTGLIRVLTRSSDDTMLTFDAAGGVREVRIGTERRVLTDEIIKRLARSALDIKRSFMGRDQDIEWVVVGHRLYVVQSRPVVSGQ
ncbi:MAG: PEP/pyruvate-binding domain-containing protein [Acidobacteriota bacterium]